MFTMRKPRAFTAINKVMDTIHEWHADYSAMAWEVQHPEPGPLRRAQSAFLRAVGVFLIAMFVNAYCTKWAIWDRANATAFMAMDFTGWIAGAAFLLMVGALVGVMAQQDRA